MAVQIQLRRGTAAQWLSADPILAEGEIGYELDTKKHKIGDGINIWSLLPYDYGGIVGLYSLPDVDASTATSPTDGSVLVYQTSINKWVATTTLNQQNMDGGHF